MKQLIALIITTLYFSSNAYSFYGTKSGKTIKLVENCIITDDLTSQQKYCFSKQEIKNSLRVHSYGNRILANTGASIATYGLSYVLTGVLALKEVSIFLLNMIYFGGASLAPTVGDIFTAHWAKEGEVSLYFVAAPTLLAAPILIYGLIAHSPAVYLGMLASYTMIYQTLDEFVVREVRYQKISSEKQHTISEMRFNKIVKLLNNQREQL